MNRTWTTGAILATLIFAACGSDANDAFVSDSVSVSEPATPEDEVRVALTQFKDAIRDKDIDAVLESYSDRYASDEAVGMAGLRAMWDRISDAGFAADLELDIETARIDIDGNIAAVAFFDETGEIACPNINTPCDTPQPYVSLLLGNEEGRGCLIIGTPHEQVETSPSE
jgi:hypothetical protein